MGKGRHSEAAAIAVRLATETAATAVALANKTAETANSLVVKLTEDAGNLRAHEKVCAEQAKTMNDNMTNMRQEIIEGRNQLKKELKTDIKQVKGVVIWMVGILTTANAGLITVLALVGWTFFKSQFHIQ